MKSFRSYLLENHMSTQQAMGLLGVDQGFTSEQLKKAYRSASMKAHPDRGGTDEEMQRVNAAYEILKTAGSTSSQDAYAWMEEAKKAAAKYLAVIDPDAFKTYLSALFETELVPQDSGIKETRHYASRKMEFASEGRETVITVRFSFQYASFYNSQSRLSSSNSENLLPASVITSYEILHNRQKMKITSSTIDLSKDLSVLTDPSRLFPQNKVKKKIDFNTKSDGTAPAKKVKKRDFITTLKNKFSDGDMVKEDVYQIKFPGRVLLQGTRHTSQRQGSWQFMMFVQRKPTGLFLTLPESDKALDAILEIIETLQKSNDPESEWNRLVDYWRSGDRAREWYPTG